MSFTTADAYDLEARALAQQSCGSCLYAVNFECRRYAPRPVVVDEDYDPAACWPRVSIAEWCGEWKISPAEAARRQREIEQMP